MKNLKVSIILATLNEEDDVEDFLRSLRKQTYKNYELIVIDGGSTDRTIDIVKKYTNQIFVRKTPLAECWNFGARKSKGGILHFMPADDVMKSKNYLKILVKTYIKYRADSVAIRTFSTKPNNLLGRAQKAYRRTQWENRQKKIIDMSNSPKIFSGGSFLKKSFFKIGGFNPKLKGSEDQNITMRAIKNNLRIIFNPAVLLYHKDPYTYSQIARQGKWYGRVLRQAKLIDKIRTIGLVSVFFFLYPLSILLLVNEFYLPFIIFQMLYFSRVLYIFYFSRDFLGSFYQVYVMNPIRSIYFYTGFFLNK